MARNDGLRDYQQEMKLRLFEEWELHRSVMVQMPTGTGKTHLLAAVVKEFLCGGGVGMRVWIVAHRRELVEQIEETVARYGMGKEPDKSAKNGRTGKDSMPEESGRVRVFSIQWLSRNRKIMDGRPDLIVIDEAHHAGLAKGGDRSAYLDMPDILKALGDPVVLATTATATAPVVAELARVLPITRTVVDETVRENLQLEDDRDLASRENRLVSIVATGEKTVIYVNSRDQSVALAKTLRKRVPDYASHIAFYNAGLTRTDRHRVEEAFRDGSLSCIVSTSAFGEGVNLPDIRHVVLYHMPFGAIEFNQMSGRAGRDGRPAVIHLLYSSRDARINERLLDCYAPERDELVTLYRALQTMWRSNRGKTGDDSFSASDIDIAQMCLAIDARTPVDERSVESGLGIFEELGFCCVSGFDDTRRIAMAENPGRVQLSRSIRYLEGLRSRMEFSAFRSWALDSCASDMLAKVNRPIVPRA